MEERRGMMIEGKMIAKIDRVLAFCNVYPKSHPSSRYSLNAAAYTHHTLSTWLCPLAVFFYCIANGRVSNCWVTALCLKVYNEYVFLKHGKRHYCY